MGQLFAGIIRQPTLSGAEMTWIDWLKKLFNEPSTLLVMFTSGALGFVIGVANGVIQKRHGGWPAFFGSALTGTIIATIVGLAVKDYVPSETVRFAIIGFCAIISDDIWAGFRTLGGAFRSNPLEFVFRVLDALRGRSTQSTPPATPKD